MKKVLPGIVVMLLLLVGGGMWFVFSNLDAIVERAIETAGTEVAGVEVRVARVSFTGELQYEISVAARYAESLLALLLEAGGELAPLPVGMEAWLRLRLEKGYLHVGTDTNGRTTPLDIGMQQPVSRRTGDFIGKRSLELPYARAPEREQLVGLIATTGLLPVGGRVIAPGYDRPPCPTQGAVTSAGFSPSLGASIGLALIERGRARTDEVVRIYADGNVNTARIAELPFLDPGNERLKA